MSIIVGETKMVFESLSQLAHKKSDRPPNLSFRNLYPMLAASDYNVVQLFFFRLNFPALEPVGDNSHLCEPQKKFNHAYQALL